ncbi:MAG: DNA gyrase subunit A [Stellaceae bacterium]
MVANPTPPSPPPPSDIAPVSIEEEMRRSYLDYAMSVIVARALPDVRDGLKPVHRRILYGMKEGGNDWNRPYRKSANIVGYVMGNYHPHGDSAIYDAMVRMAQDFSMRLPLIDGQGNFGSMDGDPPAAMRYTEARLSRAADALLDDIDKETVDFQPNYDARHQEPKVLPARFPNILVNGGAGIAVGMATNIPTHNLGEVVDACIAYIDDNAISIEALMAKVPGPDFPTGAIILGRGGIVDAYRTGRGSIVIRGKATIEEVRGEREAIVITEIPYQVNKARLVERIAELSREKQIDGISDLRDESDRHGVRVVVELKRDAMGEVVLNQLYKFTPLQETFGINMLALDNGRPVLMNLKDVIVAFVAFREEVVTKRTIYLLGQARDRAHLLLGLAVAVANIDPVIDLIRKAKDPETARAQLMARSWPAVSVASLVALIEEEGRSRLASDNTYKLSEEQAKAILDLRLQRLTGLERDKIAEELKGLTEEIRGHLEILGSRPKLLDVVRKELRDVREQFVTPRKTVIEDAAAETNIEDLIQREDMVVTVSHAGYIKRVPLATYRAQRRGGRGRAGMAVREEDFVSEVFVASTHAPVLFFTSSGRVYKIKVHTLPVGTPQSRGKAMINLLPNLSEKETISTVMPLPETAQEIEGKTIVFATAHGYVRRNALGDFEEVKANGKIAMKFEGDDKDDRLIAAAICTASDDVLLATRNGKVIRFSAEDVRVFSSRGSVGVRGIKLAKGDEVFSMSILRHEDVESELRYAYIKEANRRRHGEEEAEDADADETAAGTITETQFNEMAAREEFLLTVTERGFGKRCSAYDYRITGRGGQGIENMKPSRNQGATVAVFPVRGQDQLMLVTNEGTVIRTPVQDISIRRRGSGGVRVFTLDEGARVVSVAHLAETGENSDGEAGGK